jgi:hypothetical protein
MYTESQPFGVEGLGAVQPHAQALTAACYGARDAILEIVCTEYKQAAAQRAKAYVEGALNVLRQYGTSEQQLYALQAYRLWQGYSSGNTLFMLEGAAIFHCLGRGHR